MPQPQLKTIAVNVAQIFAQALRLHEQGRLAEAEPLYAAVLKARPDHIDALQMMGLVQLAKGEPAEALRLIAAALRARSSPQTFLNHGLALNALGRHAEALESFDRALKMKSKFAEAHNNRGAALAALGREAEAEQSYRKAIAIKPDYAEAHYNLGSLLRTLGRYEEALKSLDRALALRPNYVKAHNNRGLVLEVLDRNEDALAAYDSALSVNPGFVEARSNRGRVLISLGRYEEALDNYEQAANIATKPELHYLRGQVLLALNRNDEAIEDFRHAIALRPDAAEARVADCMAELRVLYADEYDIIRRRRNYAEKLERLAADLQAGKLAGDLTKTFGLTHLFFLAYQGFPDRDLQAVYGAALRRAVVAEYPDPPLPAPPAPGEPVRIGIVSAYFHLHSNWKIPIKGWLSQLDRARFKIFGYHVGKRADSETAVATSLCDRFVHRPLDIGGWRREILADAPHVLIYPGLFMDPVTILLAAQRLAPVQCTSWGHPETSGLPTIDYFLSSDLMEPPNAQEHYTERLVRLPNLSIYYEPLESEPVVVERAEIGLRPHSTAFWCGQSLYKYLPQYDHVFPRIACQLPDCQFLFLRHLGGEQHPVNRMFLERLDRAFSAYGLKAEDHCVMLPRLSQSQYIAAMGHCAAFLDSIGWSGCNSALESLPHNLPFITFAGDLMRGRHVTAILTMLGMSGMVAQTLDDYVAIAARVGIDQDLRGALSRHIAETKQRLYRDRACIEYLQDFLEQAAREPPREGGHGV